MVCDVSTLHIGYIWSVVCFCTYRKTTFYFILSFCMYKNRIISWESPPPWCKGRALEFWSKGQRFDSWCRQLTKFLNLDENSWTPTKIIKKRGWDDNACLGVRNTSSIGAWPNSLDRRPPWHCIVSPLLQTNISNLLNYCALSI